MIESTKEKPPDIQKGSGKPPTSNRNPPMVGPNIVPIPKQDSARAVALPWFSSVTCWPARVKAAGVRDDSPGVQCIGHCPFYFVLCTYRRHDANKY